MGFGLKVKIIPLPSEITTNWDIVFVVSSKGKWRSKARDTTRPQRASEKGARTGQDFDHIVLLANLGEALTRPTVCL